MSRRIIKFRNPHKPRIGASVFVVISAITSAVAVFALIFILTKFIGWTQPRPVYDSGPLRGVAMEEVLYKPQVTEETDAVIKNLSGSSTHGRRGEKDVPFLEFEITPRTDGKLAGIVFSLNGYARPYDVSGLQLYVNEKFLSEKPMFQGQANFEGLNVKLNAGETVNIRVTGKISDQANAGDRIQIDIREPSDLSLRGSLGGSLSLGGDFPLKGRFVSVIGDPLE